MTILHHSTLDNSHYSKIDSLTQNCSANHREENLSLVFLSALNYYK